MKVKKINKTFCKDKKPTNVTHQVVNNLPIPPILYFHIEANNLEAWKCKKVLQKNNY